MKKTLFKSCFLWGFAPHLRLMIEYYVFTFVTENKNNTGKNTQIRLTMAIVCWVSFLKINVLPLLIFEIAILSKKSDSTTEIELAFLLDIIHQFIDRLQNGKSRIDYIFQLLRPSIKLSWYQRIRVIWYAKFFLISPATLWNSTIVVNLS